MPSRARTSAAARPAGPAPTIATLAGLDDVRHVGPPALRDRLVGDVALDVADRDGAHLVDRAGALAEPVLRAHPAADLGQRVGLVRKLGGLEQLALLDQGEPFRDVVVHRAVPLAVRVAAVEAAAGLLRRIRGIVVAVNFAEVADALLGGLLLGVASRDFQELEGVLGHFGPQAAWRSDWISEPSSAALGFTSQNFGR